MAEEEKKKKRLNPLNSQATLNNFPEVQGHKVQERVLFCFLPHLPCNCKLKEKYLTDGRCSKRVEHTPQIPAEKF